MGLHQGDMTLGFESEATRHRDPSDAMARGVALRLGIWSKHFGTDSTQPAARAPQVSHGRLW